MTSNPKRKDNTPSLEESLILRKLIAITGIGCSNCGASQLIDYYVVKNGKGSKNICSKCCTPKQARILNWQD